MAGVARPPFEGRTIAVTLIVPTAPPSTMPSRLIEPSNLLIAEANHDTLTDSKALKQVIAGKRMLARPVEKYQER